MYTKIRKHSLNHFWYDALERSNWLDLTNEKNFAENTKASSAKDSSSPKDASPLKTTAKPIENSETSASSSTTTDSTETPATDQSENQKCTNAEKCNETVTVADDSDSDCEIFASEELVSKTKGIKLKLEQNDRELFCTGLTFGTQDYIGQRVLQVAQILRNLSFAEENMPLLAKNRTFFRFMLLCAGSRWNSIHQLGLDMLSNIASEINIKEQTSRLSECVISFVTDGLQKQDRSVVIACLEILNKLSQNELNEDYLLKTLEQKTYFQVCSFLTLHDVMLLIYTLECLYSLSSLGERACNYIVDVHGIIDTLVSLVTVEGKSYGPKACIGMKLVETVSGLSGPIQQTPVPTPVAVPQPVAQPNLPLPKPLQTLQQASQFLRTVVSTPQKAAVATPTFTQTTPLQQAAVGGQQSIAQQHAHQQAIQENEQFALAYLRATYEPCTSGRIEQQELYKQYLNACAKIGRRGVIAPLHFPRCVR